MPLATCVCSIEDQRLPSFYALFAGFALTMLCGPLMNNVGALLDCDRADDPGQHLSGRFRARAESIEAAWKYIVVVSAGISLALLGTVLFYWDGSFVLGPTLRHDLGGAAPMPRRA